MTSRSYHVTDRSSPLPVFVFQAFWSRFFPVYQKIRAEIADGVIGRPMWVTADFTSKLDTVARLTQNKLGGGSLLDIGVYPIQLALMVFGEDPIEIKASGHLNDDGGCFCTVVGSMG